MESPAIPLAPVEHHRRRRSVEHFRATSALSTMAALALLASPAWAGAPLHSLSLGDAIRLAQANNPDNRSVGEDVNAARGALHQSKLLENPVVWVGTDDRNIHPTDAPIPDQLGVSWDIPIGGKRGAGIAAARADLDAAKASQKAASRQLSLDVETTFVAVLLDRSQLDFARDDQARIHETVQLNELRYKDGKISYGDLLKLRIQERGVNDTVRQDELVLAQDRADLARLVGEGVLAPDFSLTGDLAAPRLPTGLTPETVLARALARRPDYQALLVAQRSARASLKQAHRQPIPDLGISLDYNRVPGTAGSFDLAVSAAIPIFDRNQGNVTQAEAAHRKALYAAASLRAQIRADALKAVRAWETSQKRLEVYDQELLSEARESLEITRHAYEQGRGSLLDYLDAEASYRDVASAYRSALADAMLAAANVRFVAGEDLL